MASLSGVEVVKHDVKKSASVRAVVWRSQQFQVGQDQLSMLSGRLEESPWRRIEEGQRLYADFLVSSLRLWDIARSRLRAG